MNANNENLAPTAAPAPASLPTPPTLAEILHEGATPKGKPAKAKTPKAKNKDKAKQAAAPAPAPERALKAKPAPAKPAKTPQPKPVKEARDRRRAALEADGNNLAKLCAAWIEHLTERNLTPSSVASYEMDCAVWLDILGPETDPAKVGPKTILKGWNHPRIIARRDGGPKSGPMRERMRRAFRMAFTWAVDGGLFGLDDSKDAAKLFPPAESPDKPAAALSNPEPKEEPTT